MEGDCATPLSKVPQTRSGGLASLRIETNYEVLPGSPSRRAETSALNSRHCASLFAGTFPPVLPTFLVTKRIKPHAYGSGKCIWRPYINACLQLTARGLEKSAVPSTALSAIPDPTRGKTEVPLVVGLIDNLDGITCRSGVLHHTMQYQQGGDHSFQRPLRL